MPWTRRRFLKLGIAGGVAGGVYYFRACYYPGAREFAGVRQLSPRTAAILASVVEAVLPPSAELDHRAVVEHVRAVDAQLASFAPSTVSDLNHLLYLVEQSPLPLAGRLRRFSGLPLDERVAYLSGWATSDHDLLRAGLRGLVAAVFLVYYRDARAFAGAGYPGPLLPGGGTAGDYRRLVAPAGTLP